MANKIFIYPTGLSNTKLNISNLMENQSIILQTSNIKIDWLNILNKPVSFPPISHKHDFSEILNLPAGNSYGDMVASVYDPSNKRVDIYNRANHTGNLSADIIVDGTTNKVYTATEKTKLAGLSNYIHPTTHPTSIIIEDTNKQFVSAADKTNWNNKASSTHNHDTSYAIKSSEHTHSNKTLLDTYTQTETNLSSAVTNSHTHTNKTTIDKITESAGSPLWDGGPWPGVASSSGHTIEDEGVALAQRDSINFTGAGVTVTDSGTKTIVNIPGPQPDQNAFSIIAVSGQSSIIADATTDTVTFASGTGISISTDAATDTITITATGGGTGGAHATSHITGGSDIIPDAVANGASGLLAGSDKAKLDSIISSGDGTSFLTNDGTYKAASNTTVVDSVTNGNIVVNGSEINVYTHPTTHSADEIVDGTTNKVFTSIEKTKLDGIASGAEVNVQSDWNQVNNTLDDYIKNKPTLGTSSSKDIPVTGDASATEVVLGNDSRLTNSRTPTTHTHIQSESHNTADTDLSTTSLHHTIGTGANQAAAGDHTHTKGDIGLGNVTNDSQVKRSEMGVANGVATLDGTAKIPPIQLPSYVSDVLEFANVAAFPTTGETNKIYIAINGGTASDPSLQYRWSGTVYSEISPSPGSTDVIPEGSTNLYYTNVRAAAAAPIQSVAGKTGTVTLDKSDVGLANVDNTSDVNKNVLSATKLTTSRTINGVTFDGTQNITIADDTKVVANVAIVGGTKTKVTYDSKGLVTSGTDATTADIVDSLDKRYVSDAEKAAITHTNRTALDNVAGTNTGDQNIFSTVAAGGVNVVSSSTTETLNIAASGLLSITADNTTKTITFTNDGTKVTVSATEPVSPVVGEVWIEPGSKPLPAAHDHSNANMGGLINIAAINATGTADSTTALFGDGSWKTPSSSDPNSHTHTNKTLLDTYDQTNANITSAITNNHTHSNKTLLDTYSQTEVNLADAVTKKHSHTNATTLDKITESAGSPLWNGSAWPGGTSQWITTGSDIYYTTGKVGIGTTIPIKNLDIAASAEYTECRVMSYSAGSEYSVLSMGKSKSATVGTLTATVGGDILGRLAYVGVNTSSDTRAAAVIECIQSNNLAGGDLGIPGDLVLSTNPGGASGFVVERMRVSSAGKVGIGTTPYTTLDIVSGKNRFTVALDGTGTSIGNYTAGTSWGATPVGIVTNGTYNGYFGATYYDGATSQWTGYTSFLTNGTMAAGSIPTDYVIATGSSGTPAVRLRVTSAGNLRFSNQPAAPTAYNSAGASGDFYVSESYIYSHNGTRWGRVAIDYTTTW